MGANHPKERVQTTYLPRKESSKAHNGGSNLIEDVTVEDKPALTLEQIKLIQTSWKLLQEDIAKVGIVMFMK